MNTYAVKKINLDLLKNKNAAEYWQAVQHAPVTYCIGLEEVKKYVGGKLHRQRAGYSGIIGNIEYIAVKC